MSDAHLFLRYHLLLDSGVSATTACKLLRVTSIFILVLSDSLLLDKYEKHLEIFNYCPLLDANAIALSGITRRILRRLHNGV